MPTILLVIFFQALKSMSVWEFCDSTRAYLMQLSGSVLQYRLQPKRTHDVQPMGGRLAKPLSRATFDASTRLHMQSSRDEKIADIECIVTCQLIITKKYHSQAFTEQRLLKFLWVVFWTSFLELFVILTNSSIILSCWNASWLMRTLEL